MKLRDYLDQNGLTLEKFSHIAGVSLCTVRNIARYNHIPNLHTAHAIFLASKGAIGFVDQINPTDLANLKLEIKRRLKNA